MLRVIRRAAHELASIDNKIPETRGGKQLVDRWSLSTL